MKLKAILMATAIIFSLSSTIVQASPLTLAEKEHQAVETMKEVWDFENGCLTDEADEETLERAKDFIELLPEKNEHRQNLENMADAAEAELSEPAMTYYGNCRITGYCNCSACCGIWAGGGTASGTTPTAGRTVANGSLPFGTRVLINGHEYIVEDRGVPGEAFDIYFSTHAEASACGLHYTEVYIIG